MVDDLADRPTPVPIGGIELVFFLSSNGLAHARGQAGNLFNVALARVRCWIWVRAKASDGIAEIIHTGTFQVTRVSAENMAINTSLSANYKKIRT
jgi:hypothetical protein